MARVWFPIESLGFLIRLILRAALDSASNRKSTIDIWLGYRRPKRGADNIVTFILRLYGNSGSPKGLSCFTFTFNPLNAELNSICHMLVLLGNLTFMGPCIVNIFQYISTRCNVTQFIYIWKLLYMFRVVLPPIIGSAYNCIHSIWYLSHRYCYLPLSWKSWNQFECGVGGVRHPHHTQTTTLLQIYVITSHWYIILCWIHPWRRPKEPETCSRFTTRCISLYVNNTAVVVTCI
jgi:hypothetical protein